MIEALPADVEALGRRLSKLAPVLHFLVRHEAPYTSQRRWGEFDQLSLRAIDDLAWDPKQESDKTVVAFTELPAHGSDVIAVSVPTAVALERLFFHLQEIGRIEINPKNLPDGLPRVQRGIEYSLPTSSDDLVIVVREQIPELLGFLSSSARGKGKIVEKAEAALRDNLLFECFYLARKARRAGVKDAAKAWFLELWSFSFLGLPEEALKLYEEYPERDNPDPLALIVSARYRLLLKQFNEARTIFHTMSHNLDVAARAECELARSYISSGEFARAIDLASSSIRRDAGMIESYLVRGVAHRGLSYSSGEEEGLREALKDFEKVATEGGFHAPEACFHAGTVFARLGDLVSAEQSLRQSLFQRDRFSSRDALIRVLSAAGKWEAAREECAVLSSLAPQATATLAEELARHASEATPSGVHEEGVQSELWSPAASAACEAARKKLDKWRVPVTGAMTDVILLDDFINRFAPAGEFVNEGECAAVSQERLSVVSRVLALQVARVLAAEGLVTIEEPLGNMVRVVTAKDKVNLNLEEFVEERVLLGAAGDNVSSLESLLADAGAQDVPDQGTFLPSWWQRAESADIDLQKQLTEAVKVKLCELGANLSGTLSDLEELDRVIEEVFEPGGKSEKFLGSDDTNTISSFVIGVGLLVGSIIGEYVPVTWFRHQQPEGISFFNVDMGRFFPIARVQRRIYLASAADFGVRLGALALGVAVAAAAHKVRSGEYKDEDDVRKGLLALLPSLSRFSEEEINGVIRSLVKG